MLLPKEVNVPKKVNAFSLMPQHLVAATKVSLIDINQSKRTPMTMEARDMQRSAQMLQQQNGTYLSRRLRVRHERREERRGGGEATSK